MGWISHKLIHPINHEIFKGLSVPNINTEKKAKQSSINRRSVLIKSAQKEWLERISELEKTKSDLGYERLSWDEFLEILPLDENHLTKRSQIIALQDQYKEHKEYQQHIWAEDNLIAEFNKIHAIVHLDQTYILTEKKNSMGEQDFSLESRQSFKSFYEDEIIMCIDGVERCKADVWLKSNNRRKYKGVMFDPRPTEVNNDYYNLWKGFTKKPIQGNCNLYWEHVKENICSNSNESYQYIRKWISLVFQKPHEVHTALVLCGSQGVGKNSFIDPLGTLLGPHYAPLSSIAELISNFNYHLKNAVLIHANEALWGGNKKDIGALKAMITEKTCLIEGKGKDRIVVRNFKHIILSSNEDWPLHLDPDDRRFFVLRVSEKRKEDHQYFKSIQNELNNGGYEALLCDLLHEDLSNFNPRTLPSTSDSFAIKMRSSDSAHRYLYEVLCEGGFSIGEVREMKRPVWQEIIPKNSAYEDYMLWCKKSGEDHLSKALFGKTLNKIIVSMLDTRPGKARTWSYKFPSLRQSRQEFCKAFKEDAERIFEDDQES